MELTGFLFFLGLALQVRKDASSDLARSGRCLVVEGMVVEEFRVEHQAAQADLLLEPRSEEAPALLLVEALTAPVAPILTVPATARPTAPAPLTAPALALLRTAQDLVLPQAPFSTPQMQEEVLMEAGTREGQ